MANHYEGLVAEFKTKFEAAIEATSRRGIEMRPYYGVRTPLQQAALWRQGRTRVEITDKMAFLKAQSAPYMASCLESAGPQDGRKVTNALPGASWHNWGEAMDSFWVVNGTSEWSTTKQINGLNGYVVMAQEAAKIGLTPGGYFKSIKDWPHIQLRPEASPNATGMSWAQIDLIMYDRFGKN